MFSAIGFSFRVNRLRGIVSCTISGVRVFHNDWRQSHNDEDFGHRYFVALETHGNIYLISFPRDLTGRFGAECFRHNRTCLLLL